MAVTGISHKEAVERQHKMEAWSGVISWSLYGLLAVLVIAVVLVLMDGQRKEKRLAELRASWDQYYLAFKDKEAPGTKGLDNAERIPVLEGLWEKTKGTPVQPFVALELAQAHYQEALDAEKDPASGHRVRVEESIKKQAAALKKALDVFNVVRTSWPDNPSYGPLGYEGAALCNEQLKDYSAAIGLLEDAVKKYSKHFLAEKMRYDLARNYWLRALKTEADGKSAKDDREKALEHISRAISEVADKDVSPMSWRFQARYLRSLIEKKDEALKIFPDGKPPVRPQPKKAEANQDGPAQVQPAKADAQAKKEEEKPAEAKPAPEAAK
jgi:tetratricopeptide (TPR) repeat protein